MAREGAGRRRRGVRDPPPGARLSRGADRHRQAGRSDRGRVHRRRRGDPAGAAAGHPAGDEHPAAVPADPVLPRRRAPGDRRLRGRGAADRRRRRRLHPLSPALRDFVPGGLSGRVDRRLRRRVVGDGQLQLRRADRDADRAGPGRDGDRLRDPAPGRTPVERSLALPVGAGDVGPAPDHAVARPRGARGRRRGAA